MTTYFHNPQGGSWTSEDHRSDSRTAGSGDGRPEVRSLSYRPRRSRPGASAGVFIRHINRQERSH
jgi:hypothetical protein